jgi:hypothetical protein
MRSQGGHIHRLPVISSSTEPETAKYGRPFPIAPLRMPSCFRPRQVEEPSSKIPTANIGDRQKGRVRAESAMDCKPAAVSISLSIRKAISPEFQAVLKVGKNPYAQADMAARIVEMIMLFRHTELMKKSFYNLGRLVQ